MRSILTTITAAILLPLFSLAQSNYKTGYIVSRQGDTVKGYIDYQEWEKNPVQVAFKSSTGAIQQCTPESIKGFGVDGLEYYEAYVANISLDAMDITHAGGVVDDRSKQDAIFLRILNKGRALTLFSYQDAIKVRYYVREQDNAEPKELEYHVYVDANLATKYVTRYRAQLQYIAQRSNAGDDRLSGWISSAKYDEHDLLKIAAAINGNEGSQPMAKSQFGTRFFAGAGISNTDMSFNGYIEYGDSYGLFPRISAGIDLITNKQTQRLFARLEIAATGDEHTFTNTYEKSQLKMKQYTASFVTSVYYNFYSGKNLKVFGGGGLAMNFSVYPERYYISPTGIDLIPMKQDKFPDYHTLWITPVFKAGVTLHDRIELYAGYVPLSTVTDNYESFAGNVSSYQAGVNFLFGIK